MNQRLIAVLTVFSLLFTSFHVYSIDLEEKNDGYYVTLIAEKYDKDTGELLQREVVEDDLVLRNWVYFFYSYNVAYDVLNHQSFLDTKMRQLSGAYDAPDYDGGNDWLYIYNADDGVSPNSLIHIGTGSNAPVITDWSLQTKRMAKTVDGHSYSSQGTVMNGTLEATFAINGTWTLRESGLSLRIQTDTGGEQFLVLRDVFPGIAVTPANVFKVRYVFTFNEGG